MGETRGDIARLVAAMNSNGRLPCLAAQELAYRSVVYIRMAASWIRGTDTSPAIDLSVGAHA
jgi:hypothetical protein